MSSEAGSLVPVTAERGLGANRTQVRHLDVAGEAPGDWFDNIRATSKGSSVDADSALVVTHSDEALIEQLGTGNKDALALLFRRYARMVRAVAYRILRNPSEAEDLLQDVFLFLFLKSQLFDKARGPARSWIVQVTYHRAIDRRRYLISRRFYSSLDFGDSAIGSTELGTEIAFYEQSLEGTFGKAMLKRIDESLSDDQRRTIQLHFFEGYTLEEIAARTGQSLGNVRNHYYRGLDRMRQIVFAAKLQAK